MKLHLRICAIGLLASLAAFGAGTAAFAKDDAAACPALKGLDADSDGTLDLNEAKAEATKLFDKADKDKDSSVTAKELQGRLSKKDLAANDPDHDGTLSKDEYLALVEARFKAANTDGDGTIDCKEAKSEAGHALIRLLK